MKLVPKFGLLLAVYWQTNAATIIIASGAGAVVTPERTKVGAGR